MNFNNSLSMGTDLTDFDHLRTLTEHLLNPNSNWVLRLQWKASLEKWSVELLHIILRKSGLIAAKLTEGNQRHTLKAKPLQDRSDLEKKNPVAMRTSSLVLKWTVLMQQPTVSLN